MPASSLDTPTAHADLVRRQILAIADRTSQPSEDREGRMTRRANDGLVTLQEVLAGAGVTQQDLGRCRALADADSRFEFLRRLLHAATVGGAAGDATERAIFGSCSGEPRSIASLVQVFSLVLDGLLDEAPDILAPERSMLIDLMTGGWEPTFEPPAQQEIDGKHEVMSLLFKIAIGWISLVKRTQGWSSDRSVRKDLPAAVAAAMRAEYSGVSSMYEITSGQVNIEHCRKAIIAKSANAVWVSALAPICSRGWPANLDHDLYRRCAYLLGAYIGWIDDIEDILVDLSAGRWNLVSADLYLYSGQPRNIAPAELIRKLSQTLCSVDVQDQLIATGLGHYDELVRGIDAIEIDSQPVLELVEDATAGLVG